VAVPLPLHRGVPGGGVPWIWSVVPWIEGLPAEREPLNPQGCGHLARILKALHVSAPADAPPSDLRGVPLRSRADFMEARFGALEDRGHPDCRILRNLWSDGLAAPEATERVWLHGDLHPRNVLVRAGALSGIIDWGDITAGDPATDLAAAWMLAPEPVTRGRFWEEYRAAPALVRRARAWAVFFGVALTVSGDEGHEAMGRSVLSGVLSEEVEG